MKLEYFKISIILYYDIIMSDKNQTSCEIHQIQIQQTRGRSRQREVINQSESQMVSHRRSNTPSTSWTIHRRSNTPSTSWT